MSDIMDISLKNNNKVSSNPSILELRGSKKFVVSLKTSIEYKYEKSLNLDQCSTISEYQNYNSITVLHLYDRPIWDISTVKLASRDIMGIDARLIAKPDDNTLFFVYCYQPLSETYNFIYTLDDALNILGIVRLNSPIVNDKFFKNISIYYDDSKFIAFDFVHEHVIKYDYPTLDPLDPLESLDPQKIVKLQQAYKKISRDPQPLEDYDFSTYTYDELLDNERLLLSLDPDIGSKSLWYIHRAIYNSIYRSIVKDIMSLKSLKGTIIVDDIDFDDDVPEFKGSTTILPSGTTVVHGRFELEGKTLSLFKNYVLKSKTRDYPCDVLHPLQNRRDCSFYFPFNPEDFTDSQYDTTLLVFILLRIRYDPILSTVIHFIQYLGFPNRHMIRPVQYYNTILKISKDTNTVTAISIPFTFINCSTTGVNFVCGIIEYPDEYHISYGIDDALSFIATVPKSVIKMYTHQCDYTFKDLLFIDSHNEMYDIYEFMKRHFTNSYYIEVFTFLYDEICKNNISGIKIYIHTIVKGLLKKANLPKQVYDYLVYKK